MRIGDFVKSVKQRNNYNTYKSMGERKELSAELRKAISIIEWQREVLLSIKEVILLLDREIR